MSSADISQLCGWVDDQAAVEAVVATLPMPIFADAAPELRGSGEGKDVLFWEAEQRVIGEILAAFLQKWGTCVSQGYGRGAQDLLLGQILQDSSQGWDGPVATEPIYAGSRVEIGGGKLGREDGSTGAWAAKWLSLWGILLRKKYGNIDLTTADDDRAREWGMPRAGVPDELEPIAKLHPVRTYSLVLDADAGRDALCNWYPVPTCSNQGFTTVRDQDGFCRPRGTWYHCMDTRGYCVVKGNRPAVAIQQSWGESPTGNNRVTLESGREILLPQGVFLADMEVWDRMLRQRDSFAISDAIGFPARDRSHLLI